jgi:hypothetical protein
VHLCGFSGSQNKQRILPFTALIDYFFLYITVVESVYCAIRTGSLYKTDYVYICKGSTQQTGHHKKRQPELYLKNQHVETGNLEAPFTFFTSSLTSDLSMNGVRSEWGAR